MDEFAWTRTQAVFYNNLFYAGLAVIAIISFVSVKLLSKWLAGKPFCLLLSRVYVLG